MYTRHLACLLLGLALLSACGSAATPQPTVQPTLTPQGLPMGFTEDGLPYRGDPNAPVTMYEHSEFE